MERVVLGDPTWSDTFPHCVAPLQDEWLPGLLLRCDEANSWTSRTTLAHLLYPGKEKFDRCWRTNTPNLTVPPPRMNLKYLAQLLAVSRKALVATTYYLELARCYDISNPSSWNLNPSFSFQVCPVCLAETRLLRRTLALRQITICPQHQVVLLMQCQCGAPLQLLHRQVQPFACHICGKDWGNLPLITASPERFVLEQKYLSYYTFFFSQGNRTILLRALQLIAEKLKEHKGFSSDTKTLFAAFQFLSHIPLAFLIAALVRCDISLRDFDDYSGPPLTDIFDQIWFYSWVAKKIPAFIFFASE